MWRVAEAHRKARTSECWNEGQVQEEGWQVVLKRWVESHSGWQRASLWFSGKLVEASQEGSTMARFSSVTVVLQASRERT
jgi:hypothetical protein